jgi:tRNA pseudouridine55 synthase
MTNKTTEKRNYGEGIFLIDKPKGKTSFSLIKALRRITSIETIGHAGTLDPFATGLMVILVGKKFTRQASDFISQEKEYDASLRLGVETDTYDCDGKITRASNIVPTLESVVAALAAFQGIVQQIPPMFSAKKINGKKLYNLARQGVEIERKPCIVTMKTTLVSYNYPYLSLRIICSKGTYVRSIAYDIGAILQCGAHVEQLRRLRCGSLDVKDSIPGEELFYFL